MISRSRRGPHSPRGAADLVKSDLRCVRRLRGHCLYTLVAGCHGHCYQTQLRTPSEFALVLPNIVPGFDCSVVLQFSSAVVSSISLQIIDVRHYCVLLTDAVI